ncbi:MAG: hypothetical protein IPL75_07275 [Acidobacteria bacterium]|nr:hypothetical protein [Acidobacteriota bacterium]
MMWHLIRAQLWRVRWPMVNLFFMGFMSAATSSGPSLRLMNAMALMTAGGSLLTIGIFWSRELRVLPLAADTALRSAWCTVMVFPVAIMAGRLLVVLGAPLAGGSPGMTVEAVLLLASFDAIYIGVSVWEHQRADTPWTGLRQLLDPREALGMFGIAVWMFIPFATPELVPRSVAGVTWLHVVIALAGLVVATWPVLVTKNEWPSLGILHERQHLAPTARVPPKSTDRWIDRLRGISRLLPGQLASAVVVSLLSLAAFIAFAVGVRGDIRSPFDTGVSDLEFLFVGGPVVLMLLGPVGIGAGLSPFLRRLKAMPISATRLIFTMTVLPLATPMLYWLCAGVAHLVLVGPVSGDWRPGVLLFLSGILALGSALVTRFNSAGGPLAAAFLPFGLLLTTMRMFDKNEIDSVFALLLPGVGLSCLVAAFLLNHHVVTRLSSHAAVYRVPSSP